MINYNSLVKKWASELELYELPEAQNLVEWLLEHHLGLRRVDMMNFLEEKDLPKSLFDDFERLKKGEPIQQILGKAPFYGREFQVSRDTLIPRNETEELVHLIIKENPQSGLKILDIGTGTGCIPITLFLEMNEAEVYGLDVSESALAIAHKNAEELKAKVHWIHLDILEEELPIGDLDILVSNPPYIPEKGKEKMHRNVLDFEPELALFVPDENPLLFYRRIAILGKKALKPKGKLYFEIHEDYGKDVQNLLFDLGYSEVEIIPDLNGKDRMVKGKNL
ncbi:peptide chain release factor N(5)-glutamine methyltransferase [Algoriphagus sp. NF]|uniref:peptide chain release factor N(5)-glutamine methyltransferase n=1 Tax=Algoriphagus sp. NF TaxID=2992756 RepID=UPI00237A62EA|nr:peptide chain release factor N(5)-glutamine methyltransferase [Algoriphagus sp. NF]MDE0559149.1 peptide chain release factor N(5)-glutamine methyltransferase [Algoriphagus sp. NF]